MLVSALAVMSSRGFSTPTIRKINNPTFFFRHTTKMSPPSHSSHKLTLVLLCDKPLLPFLCDIKLFFPLFCSSLFLAVLHPTPFIPYMWSCGTRQALCMTGLYIHLHFLLHLLQLLEDALKSVKLCSVQILSSSFLSFLARIFSISSSIGGYFSSLFPTLLCQCLYAMYCVSNAMNWCNDSSGASAPAGRQWYTLLLFRSHAEDIYGCMHKKRSMGGWEKGPPHHVLGVSGLVLYSRLVFLPLLQHLFEGQR